MTDLLTENLYDEELEFLIDESEDFWLWDQMKNKWEGYKQKKSQESWCN